MIADIISPFEAEGPPLPTILSFVDQPAPSGGFFYAVKRWLRPRLAAVLLVSAGPAVALILTRLDWSIDADLRARVALQSEVSREAMPPTRERQCSSAGQSPLPPLAPSADLASRVRPSRAPKQGYRPHHHLRRADVIPDNSRRPRNLILPRSQQLGARRELPALTGAARQAGRGG